MRQGKKTLKLLGSKEAYGLLKMKGPALLSEACNSGLPYIRYLNRPPFRQFSLFEVVQRANPLAAPPKPIQAKL